MRTARLTKVPGFSAPVEDEAFEALDGTTRLVCCGERVESGCTCAGSARRAGTRGHGPGHTTTTQRKDMSMTVRAKMLAAVSTYTGVSPVTLNHLDDSDLAHCLGLAVACADSPTPKRPLGLIEGRPVGLTERAWAIRRARAAGDYDRARELKETTGADRRAAHAQAMEHSEACARKEMHSRALSALIDKARALETEKSTTGRATGEPLRPMARALELRRQRQR